MVGFLILMAIAFTALIALLSAMLAREMVRPPRHTVAYAVARGMACDPGDMGLPFESWQFDSPDGAILPVWEIQPSPQSKVQISKSLTLVFIHGWGHSRIDSLARIEPFIDLCDRIVMYDLRGHGEAIGRSRLGDGEQSDLLALLEHIDDGGEFVLIGHSMGAVIAIKAACEACASRLPIAPRIAGIIAYGPYCEFHASLRGRLAVAGYPARPVTDLALLAHRMMGLRPLSLHDAELRSLNCPLLVMHGSDDRVSPLSHARRIAAAAPHARLHVIEGASHAGSHSIDSASHDEIVRDFIRLHAGERTSQSQSRGMAMPRLSGSS